MIGINHFGIIDYIVVAATLLFSLFIGVYHAVISKQTNEDILVGGRKMGALPIAASMLVTYFSAIAILGYPAEVYDHGIQIFMMTLSLVVYVPISVYLFVSVFYKLKLTSVYEYLELRFESISVRWFASFTFILQVLLVSGVVLFAPAIALKAILGFPVWMSIALIGISGTVYTAIGGLKAVVWTDVFQFFMIITGMLTIVVKGFIVGGGVSEVFNVAASHGRLQLFDFSIDPFERHNTLNFFLGFGFSIIAMYGTHQPLVQRYCSLPTFKDAVKAITVTIPLQLFTMLIVLITGLAIFATYAGCDPILLGNIQRADQIVPYFVIEELSFIPGMMGLFVACIFSAVLSSVSSILNSLAAVTWEDFISKIPVFDRMGSKAQALTVRIISVVYGVLTVSVAFAAQNLGSIFQAVMTAVGATSGPLGAIFYMGLFMPCVNKYGACIGMIAGLGIMLFIGAQSFMKKLVVNIPLPNDISNCPIGTNFSNVRDPRIYDLQDIEWPDKIYTLSYIMYSFVGTVITVFVGLVVSILTGGVSSGRRVKRKYLHPIMHSFGCGVDSDDESDIVSPTYKAKVIKSEQPNMCISSPTSTTSRFSYRYDLIPISVEQRHRRSNLE